MINSVLSLLEQNGLGIVLLFMVGYLIVNQTLQFKALNGRMDRIEGRFDKHEKKCEERHKEFMDKYIEHGDRISRVEGRLDERQQPAT